MDTLKIARIDLPLGWSQRSGGAERLLPADPASGTSPGHFSPLPPHLSCCFTHPSVDKLAVKLQDGTSAGRPLVLLARSRAAAYRGELAAARTPKGEFNPACLAALTEASTHASAAASADPASPLLALHAALACYDAIQSGLKQYELALSQHGAAVSEAALEALVPLNRLDNRMMALLTSVRRLTTRGRKADRGDDAGDGDTEAGKGGGGEDISAGEGVEELTAPPAGGSAGGGGGPGPGPAPPSSSVVSSAELQPSDPINEVSALPQIGGGLPDSVGVSVGGGGEAALTSSLDSGRSRRRPPTGGRHAGSLFGGRGRIGNALLADVPKPNASPPQLPRSPGGSGRTMSASTRWPASACSSRSPPSSGRGRGTRRSARRRAWRFLGKSPSPCTGAGRGGAGRGGAGQGGAERVTFPFLPFPPSPFSFLLSSSDLYFLRPLAATRTR